MTGKKHEKRLAYLKFPLDTVSDTSMAASYTSQYLASSPSTQSFPRGYPQCTPIPHPALPMAKGQHTTTLARLSSPTLTTTTTRRAVRHLPSHQGRQRPHPSIRLEAEDGG